MAFVDLAGEWYLNRDLGELYYKAAPDENPNDRKFYAPWVNRLIYVSGTKNKPVRNLHFKNIRFKHVGWRLPLGGYSGIQACYYGSKYVDWPTYMPPLAVHLEYVEDCSFVKCRLAHTGACGLGFGAGLS